MAEYIYCLSCDKVAGACGAVRTVSGDSGMLRMYCAAAAGICLCELCVFMMILVCSDML